MNDSADLKRVCDSVENLTNELIKVLANSSDKEEQSAEISPCVPMKIVAVRRQPGTFKLQDFKMETGEIYNYEQMVDLIRKDSVEGVMLGSNRNHQPTIRSKADNKKGNNLSNLPSF